MTGNMRQKQNQKFPFEAYQNFKQMYWQENSFHLGKSFLVEHLLLVTVSYIKGFQTYDVAISTLL